MTFKLWHMVDSFYQLPVQVQLLLVNGRLVYHLSKIIFLKFNLPFATENQSTICHLPSVTLPISNIFQMRISFSSGHTKERRDDDDDGHLKCPCDMHEGASSKAKPRSSFSSFNTWWDGPRRRSPQSEGEFESQLGNKRRWKVDGRTIKRGKDDNWRRRPLWWKAGAQAPPHKAGIN